jgi:hypothetical protein
MLAATGTVLIEFSLRRKWIRFVYTQQSLRAMYPTMRISGYKLSFGVLSAVVATVEELTWPS